MDDDELLTVPALICNNASAVRPSSGKNHTIHTKIKNAAVAQRFPDCGEQLRVGFNSSFVMFLQQINEKTWPFF